MGIARRVADEVKVNVLQDRADDPREMLGYSWEVRDAAVDLVASLRTSGTGRPAKGAVACVDDSGR